MRASFLACVVLIAGSAIGTMAEQREKWVGRVSDTQCGRAVNAECNKKCINSGIPPVLVLDGTDEVLPIANSETVKRYAGEHVEITGTLAGNVLNVGAVRIAEGGIAAFPATSTEKYRGNYRISADHVIGIDSFVGDDGKDVLVVFRLQIGGGAAVVPRDRLGIRSRSRIRR